MRSARPEMPIASRWWKDKLAIVLSVRHGFVKLVGLAGSGLWQLAFHIAEEFQKPDDPRLLQVGPHMSQKNSRHPYRLRSDRCRCQRQAASASCQPGPYQVLARNRDLASALTA